jgi:hypothetical protein
LCNKSTGTSAKEINRLNIGLLVSGPNRVQFWNGKAGNFGLFCIGSINIYIFFDFLLCRSPSHALLCFAGQPMGERLHQKLQRPHARISQIAVLPAVPCASEGGRGML